MSKFDAAMGLGIISGFTLFFLWVYGLISLNAPKAIKIVSQIISYMLCAALTSFVVYCILILVGY